jgi:hypothetical protein
VQADVCFNYKRGSYKGCYYDVVVSKNNRQYNISMFHPWEDVVNVLLSPDEHYLLVRHKPQSGNAYLLSVYDITTLKLVRRLAPGYGGSFVWNNRHQIIHQWGCGTNCSNFRIYDLQLNELFFSPSSGGFLISDNYNYLVQFSMHGDKMWVFDLRQINHRQKPLVFECHIDSMFNTEHIKFVSDNKIVMESNNSRLPNQYIDLNKVKWKQKAPIDIGAYYSREL